MTNSDKITPFDRQLADLMQRLCRKTQAIPERSLKHLEQLTLQVASKTRDGYVAVPLDELQEYQPEQVKDLPVVGSPEDSEKPLIMSETHAWLARYWLYEQRLSEVILRLMADKPKHNLQTVTQALQQDLDRYFPAQNQTIDWQKIAACLVLQNGFSIISGGPGTGKTTTITRILALLVQHLEIEPSRILLAAPTGKAAMRMQEAIQQAKRYLNLDAALQAKIPEQGTTIHRLLGYQPNRIDFRYNQNHRLPLDVLIVDEASMIDIALMTQLLEAVPNDARVILLGDKDQLASVETGSVFRDLCSLGKGQQYNQYSQHQSQVVSQWAGVNLPVNEQSADQLHDHLVVLERSYRFHENSGIGQLAKATNTGNDARLLEVLNDENYNDLEWLGKAETLKNHYFLDDWHAYFKAVKERNIQACFDTFNHFRVLSSQRRGKRGTVLLNQHIEQLVRRHTRAAYGEWYAGRPIMVTQNDYRLNLFNGDVGITLPDATGWRVYFPSDNPQEPARSFATVRLPLHETAWAMTIHKSQGSEFDSVLLIMPNNVDSELLGRELFYTGVTRAKKRLKIVANENVLKQALRKVTPQASCVREALCREV